MSSLGGQPQGFEHSRRLQKMRFYFEAIKPGISSSLYVYHHVFHEMKRFAQGVAKENYVFTQYVNTCWNESIYKKAWHISSFRRGKLHSIFDYWRAAGNYKGCNDTLTYAGPVFHNLEKQANSFLKLLLKNNHNRVLICHSSSQLRITLTRCNPNNRTETVGFWVNVTKTTEGLQFPLKTESNTHMCTGVHIFGMQKFFAQIWSCFSQITFKQQVLILRLKHTIVNKSRWLHA